MQCAQDSRSIVVYIVMSGHSSVVLTDGGGTGSTTITWAERVCQHGRSHGRSAIAHVPSCLPPAPAVSSCSLRPFPCPSCPPSPLAGHLLWLTSQPTGPNLCSPPAPLLTPALQFPTLPVSLAQSRGSPPNPQFRALLAHQPPSPPLCCSLPASLPQSRGSPPNLCH